MKRTLYIAAYDVRDPKRLQHMLYTLKDFAYGGQKSVFECWLSAAEKQALIERSQQVMCEQDSFLLVKLTVKTTLYTLGIARPACDDTFLYLG